MGSCKEAEDAKIDIKSLSLEEVTTLLVSLGQPAFRARQLYQWMHVHKASSYQEMTNVPKKLRDELISETSYVCLRQEKCQISGEDGTRKYLFSLDDGNLVESVLMRYRHGNSVCISSQVGCRMGCSFCASTIGGLIRSLTPSEMLDQIYRIEADLGERVSHVVVMGMGEPLDNYENLLKFIRLLSDENGANISQRNITVSTCGLVPAIRELAGEHLQITLALSLHAPNQKKRSELMPVARRYEISAVVQACRDYFAETGRRVTFEYALAAGVNDSQEDAEELAELLEGMCCHVNLIPVNPVKERDFVQSAKDTVNAFKNKLEQYGINVTIRREMGRDIDGACGQLRKGYLER